MQKKAFWVALKNFKLNEEIQQQKNEEETHKGDTLKEKTFSGDKNSNIITSKLMSVSYNI